MAIEKMMTPVGRIVWGNPAVAQIKKDQNTNAPILKDGQPIQQWAWGVAFPKAEFNQHIWPAMQQEAATAFPNGVPTNFSWKIKDGDGVDSEGKRYSDREGYAGCFVLTVSTEAFAPPIYKFENNSYRQIDPKEIKCGDYVSMSLNIKVNVPQNKSHTPGLYVNPNGLELVGYGTEIRNAANPQDMFGGKRHSLPPGASATPIASAAPLPGAMAGSTPAGFAPQQQGFAPQPAPMGYPLAGAPPAGFAPQPQPQYQQQGFAPQPAPMPAPAYDLIPQPAPMGYPPAGAPPAGFAPQPQPYAPMGAPQQQPAPMGQPAPVAQQWPPQGMPGLPPQGR